MSDLDTLLYGFIGGVLAFIIILLIPLLTKVFGTNVKIPPANQLVLQILIKLVLGALFGVVGAAGAFVGGPENAAKAVFLGGGSQALFKEGFASVKASTQQPAQEGAPEKPVHSAVKAIASSGQSLLFRDWR